MKTQSTVKPENVHLSMLGGDVKVRLTKNIEEVEIEQEEGTETVYEYDEIVFKVSQRKDLKQSIENNFDDWFEFGVELNEKDKEIERKSKRIKELISEYQLADELDEKDKEIADLWYELVVGGGQ